MHLEAFGWASQKTPRKTVFSVQGGAFMAVWLTGENGQEMCASSL